MGSDVLRSHSKHQLHCNLSKSRRTRCGDRSISEIGRRDVRVVEIGVIENIEELSAELDIDLLTRLEVLEQRQIPILYTRASDNIRCGVPVLSWRWRDERCAGGGVEVEVSSLLLAVTALKRLNLPRIEILHVADSVGTPRARWRTDERGEPVSRLKVRDAG